VRHGSRRRAMTVLALAATAVVCRALGQQPTFRARVDLVRLQVLVTAKDRPVSGLTVKDFEVQDRGVRQPIEAVLTDPRPLDVLLVMDRSESMAGDPLARLKIAAHEVVDALGPADRCGLLSFSQELALDADLTRQRSSVHDAIDGLRAEGLTSILDATYSAISLSEPADRRLLILLFSDGLDNRSWVTAADVWPLAARSEAVVASVAFIAPSSISGPASGTPQPDLPFLRSLTAGTGGDLIVVSRHEEFSRAFATLLEQARSRYLVTYYPTGVDRPGWHDIKVSLKGRKGQVLSRRGYWVGGVAR
jgi:VWFA-related protein